MVYENMPLYPRMGYDCDRDACVRVPVFGGARCGAGRLPDECACRRVTIENPCRPGEVAEVYLASDADLFIVRQVRQACNEAGVRIVEVESKKQLGEICGVDVKTASAGILK